jgi:hypothetical protein
VHRDSKHGWNNERDSPKGDVQDPEVFHGRIIRTVFSEPRRPGVLG